MKQAAGEISTDALRWTLQELLGPGRVVTAVHRTPWEYATSHHMELLHVELSDDARLDLLLKDLSPSAQLDDARRTRPADHHAPQREIEVYQRVLAVARVGAPYYYGASIERTLGRYWLFIENVRGIPLWQCDYDAWPAVADWLAMFHTTKLPPLPQSLPTLSADYFAGWVRRAKENHPELNAFDFDRIVGRLSSMPKRFIHGEFYPSNILMQDGRVRPIDWETAALGPALIDLAALTSGKMPAAQRDMIVRRYRLFVPATERFQEDLAFCRLHLAMQWLGWSDDWTPPREHAQDWLGEAVRLADELGLRR